MVKSKKISKKMKTDTPEVESPAENTENTDIKTEDESEKTTQENGDVEVSVKKKGKGKALKKEEVESSGENASEDKTEEEIEKTTQENGEVDVSLKKKGKSHKAAKKEKPVEEPSRKSSRAPKPITKETEEEESYEVEKLVDFRLQRGKPQFLVRWKGYSKSDDTWEDEAGLNCPELLQKYKADHPDAGKTTKKRAASKSPAKSHKKSKESNKDYEVEEIVGMKIKNGKKEFKIHWKGYKSSDDTWEPEKHLSCQDLIKAYLEEHAEDEEAEEKKTPAKKAKTAAKSTKSTKSRKTKAK